MKYLLMTAAVMLFIGAASGAVEPVTEPPKRPSIGLALGGGGARGWAHVGVLRVLEEMNVPVDYIAGTSIGAVVGGLYASGLSVDELEQELRTIEWDDALSDRTPYRDLSFRRKEDENRYLTSFEAGLRGGKLQFPPGLRSGQKLRLLLQSYLIPVAGVDDFSRLPIPFKAVAANLETGETVLLDHGDLALAIRASMSMPGIFSPVEIDGRTLVDGGIASNVPVEVVRAMGADIVIAVDVGAPLLDDEKLGSLFSVTNQTIGFLTRKNTEQSLALADIVIRPTVAQFGTLQFEAHDPIVEAGASETRKLAERLTTLSVAPAEYALLSSTRRVTDSSGRRIDFVVVEGSRVDPTIIRRLLTARAGRELDPERLRRDIGRIYGLDDFEQVSFALKEVDGRLGLYVNLKHKPWGPHYLRFAMNLSNDLHGASSFGIIGSITSTRLNSLGAEWRNEFHIGTEHGLVSEFFQPLDRNSRFFVSPGAAVMRSQTSLFARQQRIATYDVDQAAGWFDVGVQFDHRGELRLGVMKSAVHADVDVGDPSLPSHKIDLGGYHAALTMINIDRPTIPLDGNALSIEVIRTEQSFGSDDEYSKLSAAAFYVTTRGRHTVLVGGAGGSNLGTTLPFYDEFELGGLMNLGGFATGQLRGQRFALARAAFYRRIYGSPSEAALGVYAGLFLEGGNAWPAGVAPSSGDIHRSATIGVAAETFLGPIIVAYGRAETGDDQFYIAIGKTFSIEGLNRGSRIR